MTMLGNLSVGTTVKLAEAGGLAKWRVVQQGKPSDAYDSSFDGVTWLERLSLPGTSIGSPSPFASLFMPLNKSATYADSDLDLYLRNTCFSQLDSSIQNAVRTVRIPYYAGVVPNGEVRTGGNGLPRKIFVLSAVELGVSASSLQSCSAGHTNTDAENLPIDGAKLAYYGTGCEATSNRTESTYNSGNIGRWTRSTWKGMDGRYNRAWCTNPDGRVLNYACNYSMRVRPVICVPSTVTLNDDGTMPALPTSPPSISIPSLTGGESTLVSWTASTDADGDLAGYELEQKNDSGSYVRIYRGTNTSFSVTVPFGVSQLTFRVRAYDSAGNYSDYTSASAKAITNQHRPTTPNGIVLPEEIRSSLPFTISWGESTDTDGNFKEYVLERAVDGDTYAEIYRGAERAYTDVVSRGTQTVQYRVCGVDTHGATSEYTTSAIRQVINATDCSVMLHDGLPASDTVTLAMLSIEGSLPEDADLSVEMTNNFQRDANGAVPDSVVWEDCTADVLAGRTIELGNRAGDASCFNFRIHADAGPSGEGGYISRVLGDFCDSDE